MTWFCINQTLDVKVGRFYYLQKATFLEIQTLIMLKEIDCGSGALLIVGN